MLIIKSTFVKIRLLHISAQKKILISALDWGMGHTTRSVPIIQYIINSGYEVIFAGNNWQCTYIKQTFPSITAINLEGYNVSYNQGRKGFMITLLKQLPGILKTIRKEHKWLQKVIEKENIDGVISDNRYGLWAKRKPCVIMTHQLSPISGLGKRVDNIIRRLHYQQLKKFTDCWVVDIAGSNNLSGKLGHPYIFPENAHYIGLLSQLEDARIEKVPGSLLILLSGPEPQRSILSDILWNQLKNYEGHVYFVEGNDSKLRSEKIPHNIQYFKRIERSQLQPLLEDAEFVICRSGYSTLMDLARLNKKAIVIPTPGQTEQLYLADYLRQQGMLLSYDQKQFDLITAIEDAQKFACKKFNLSACFTEFESIVSDWLKRL